MGGGRAAVKASSVYGNVCNSPSVNDHKESLTYDTPHLYLNYMNNYGSNNLPEFHKDFGPESSGDLILRSMDNVDFKVHTLLLSIASPVMASLFGADSQPSVMIFGETSEALFLMLSFIYPRPTPTISSFEVLEQGLRVAEKYQLEGMKSHLRKELSLRNSQVSIPSYPLRALAIALAHGLTEEAATASELVSQNHHLLDVDELVKMAEAMPSSAHVIKLVGLPSARMAILTDVLFRYNKEPMVVPHSMWKQLRCIKCQTELPTRAIFALTDQWRCRWSFWAFQELAAKPLSECGYVFTVQFLESILHRGPTPLPNANCDCDNLLLHPSSQFKEWAKKVRDHIAKRLEVLDRLRAVV